MRSENVKRSGFIAVAGRPNAGKSTLVNQIIGQHVAIVSPIAQTTRRIVRAVAHRGDAQLIFVDLPGSQRPMDRMTERMQRSVEHAFSDIDLALWVVDATEKPAGGERHVADIIFAAQVPVIIALNKTDRAKPDLVAERIIQLTEMIGDRDYAALVPISAQTGDGVESLLNEITKHLPDGPAWFSSDEVVDMRDDERISEYIREATLKFLREELPHSTAVTVDDWIEGDDGRPRIYCTIWVDRDSQVGMVVGKHGAQIKEIGAAARKMIETQLKMRIHLELRVKTRRRWRDDDQWLTQTGL